MKRLEESSILVAGLARNCATHIEEDIQKIRSAFSNAKEISYLIIESDSSDSTVQTLGKLSSTIPRFSFSSLGNLCEHHPKRTDRISFCRNHYLYLINNDPAYSNIDFVVIADLDGVNAQLTPNAVKSCWSRENWDVCAANQAGPYYDIWALRHTLWAPNDCWREAEYLRTVGMSHFRSITTSVYSKMVRLDPSHDWIEVDSAFGGLAIYKKEILFDAKYAGLNSNGSEVCEHVFFHQHLRSMGRRIFINPSFINANVVEHARYATGLGPLKFWFRCLVRDALLRLTKSTTIK